MGSMRGGSLLGLIVTVSIRLVGLLRPWPPVTASGIGGGPQASGAGPNMSLPVPSTTVWRTWGVGTTSLLLDNAVTLSAWLDSLAGPAMILLKVRVWAGASSFKV